MALVEKQAKKMKAPSRDTIIIGVKAKEGEKQTLDVGKEYQVGSKQAALLVKAGRAKMK